MKSMWTKMLAMALALVMLTGVIPIMTDQGPRALAVGTYGKTTADEVNFRLKPNGDYLFRLPLGWVCTITDVVTSEGKTWYKVTTTQPKTTNGRVYTGYVHGDYFVKLTDAEAAAWEEKPTQATAIPSATSGTLVGQLTTSGVNFRQGPSTRSYSLFKLDKGMEVEVLSVPAAGDTDPWYRVKYNGYTGYIQGPYLKVVGGGTLPTPTPAVTPVPGTYGYIKTTMGSVNFRQTTGGSVIDRVGKDEAFAVMGPTVRVSGYTWYPVVYHGVSGYLRSDVVKNISEAEYKALQPTPVPTTAPSADPSASPADTSAPTPTGTPEPEKTTYVITVLPGVNLRRAATKDSKVYEQVKLGTKIECTGTTTTAGTLWYKIRYKGIDLYVLGSCVRVEEEDHGTPAPSAPTAIPGPTATPGPTEAPKPQGYVKTTGTFLNVRTEANGGVILGKIADKGTVLPYYSMKPVGNTTWYYVQTSFGMGYVSGKYLQMTNDPNATPTPTAAPGEPTPTPTATAAPVYQTLKLGSTGEAVKTLTTALKEQNYYTGAVTTTYTVAVRDAVKNFQRAMGLSVDGIAGQKTQEALYAGGSVKPVDPSDLTMTLYPAEKIDWYTGGIQELWPRGDNVKVYDVYTGIVWWAHRWAGGGHADIEPLTAADTARLCKIYGVSNAQEIISKDLWERRPCLVTFGNRTFACSLYGIPHGTQTILDNNYPGQCCMHFTNSKTSDTKIVSSYAVKAIQYAWEHCPAGHK